MKTYITAGALAEAMGEVEGVSYEYNTDNRFVFRNKAYSIISIGETELPSFIKAGLIKEVEND